LNSFEEDIYRQTDRQKPNSQGSRLVYFAIGQMRDALFLYRECQKSSNCLFGVMFSQYFNILLTGIQY